MVQSSPKRKAVGSNPAGNAFSGVETAKNGFHFFLIWDRIPSNILPYVLDRV